MHILLLGKNGQLGWELQRTLAPLGVLDAFDFPEIDLTNPERLSDITHNIRPNLIVNAAAFTDVDKAEHEPETAFAINTHAPARLAEIANDLESVVIHYSTDYVFDGSKGEPYNEYDRTNPINVYGQSKLEGEQALLNAGCPCIILRTSWVYSLRRDSFLAKVLGWSRKQETLKIVDDQVGSPTWARMLAEISAQIISRTGSDLSGWADQHRGIYHLAGSGAASRFEWAQLILELDPNKEEQKARDIQPALTDDFPTPARRPLYTALDCNRFISQFKINIPGWKTSLELAMDVQAER
jgi:dTDP-4-dehydrorhamnose reductase